jgi:hypothetical protein
VFMAFNLTHTPYLRWSEDVKRSGTLFEGMAMCLPGEIAHFHGISTVKARAFNGEARST